MPGKPLSEQDSRKYFIDVVLGIEYCKSQTLFEIRYNLHVGT